MFNDVLFHGKKLIPPKTGNSHHCICHVIHMLHWKLNGNILILTCKFKNKIQSMMLS